MQRALFLLWIAVCLPPAWSPAADAGKVAKGDDAAVAALMAEVLKPRQSRPNSASEDDPEAEGLERRLVETATALDHRKVVAALMPLLEHQDPKVVHLAAKIMHWCHDGVVPEQWEAVKKAYQKGVSPVMGLMASLNVDEAAELLVKEFIKDPTSPSGGYGWAVSQAGEKAVTFLMAGLEKADVKEHKAYFEGVQHVFRKMDGKAGSAVPRLLEIATSPEVEAERRKQAVLILGCIGDPAEPFFPRLRELAAQEPQLFAETVEEAIFGSPTATGALLAADYVEKKNTEYVNVLVELGAKGRVVGPRVVQWLQHEDWELRVRAAYVLGAMGYKEARPDLEKLLTHLEDWRLAYVAAQALVLLESKESIPALAAASQNHWFPSVRENAASAIEILEGEREREVNGVMFDSYEYWRVRRDALTIPAEEIPSLAKDKNEMSGQGESIEKFEEWNPRKARNFLKLRNSWDSNEGKYKRIYTVYTVPLKEGMLVGAWAGEWVGGLVHLPDKGDDVVVLQKDVHGMETWRGKLLVACGVNHMGMNEGMLYEVRTDRGKVEAVPWFGLPGDPQLMWITTKDELVIECMGGTVVFSEPGKFEYHSAPKP